MDERELDRRSRLYRPNGCACASLNDLERLALGYDVLGEGLAAFAYETLRSRTPWLDLVRCRHCGAFWYAAIDTIDDRVYLQRLSADRAERVLSAEDWPTTFDGLANVWPDGRGPSRDRQHLD